MYTTETYSAEYFALVHVTLVFAEKKLFYHMHTLYKCENLDEWMDRVMDRCFLLKLART